MAAQDEEMRLRKEKKQEQADKDSDKENTANPDILGESEDADVIF